MDTRVLYIVAVVVAAVSGGYYYYSGKAKTGHWFGEEYDVFGAGRPLTQTDDKGNLYIRAEVRQLEQDMQQKRQSWISLTPLCIN